MARFVTSGLISSISGSIGNLTFTRDTAGGVVYSKPPAKRIHSVRRQEHNLFIAQANKDWSALTDDMRLFWKSARKNSQSEYLPKDARVLTARQFYLAWRLRCLHAYSPVVFDIVPSLPLYYKQIPRVVMFSPGLGFQYYGFPAGTGSPYPTSAAWISWPPMGTRRPGRIWHKFWPVTGHTTARQVIDGDEIIFNACGVPPELRPYASGYQPQTVRPLIRHYRVYFTGQIATTADYEATAPGNRYYFKIPLDPPFYT